ncbi:MAG TPA: enoyl-CoA hydratase-related protein [Acidimicrobiales bacterium]|nr:enoyl-CoA hydratase-related protein [Acidimicrobiales bacterium]
MSGRVLVETVGPVAWLVLDNPERRNALTAQMMEQLLAAMERAGEDESVRVVVMRGAGELAFVSGADISAFGSASGVDNGPRPEDVTAAIRGLAKPVVAALRGWCLGAGVLLALAADIRLAGDDTRMGIPAAKLGIAYPRDGVDRLVALAGPAVASEMLMTGEPLDAAGARRAGLVNRVVPAAELFDEAQRLAGVLAANAPLTLVASKRTIASVQVPSDPVAAAEADEAVSTCFRSLDFKEGRQAFAEKRRPHFTGR